MTDTQEQREAAAWKWCAENDEWPRHWMSGYYLESSARADRGGGYEYFDTPLEAVEAAARLTSSTAK